MKYPHVAARVFNTPLLIHPGKLDAIIAGLGPRLLGGQEFDLATLAAALAKPNAAVNTENGPEMFSTRKGERSAQGYVITDGVAVLSVSGALVHRSRYIAADSSYLLGYNQIAADLEDAMTNSDVHAVLLNFDSPGGEVQGAFEFADRVMAMRGTKPLRAIADGLAASAAYLGASAVDAGQLAITRTGYAGSIGVVMRHVDFSAAVAADGVKVTHIFAGSHKVDGNPFEPLPESVRAEFQSEINGLYEMFIDAVATSRQLSPEAIRKTQAQTYRGQAAIDAGLADRLITTDQLIQEMAGLRARSYPVGQAARTSATANPKEQSMTGTATPTGQTPAPVTFTQADIDKARAEGHQAGATAERERISGILAHDAAVAHPAMARQCIDSGLTAEQSTAMLNTAPKNVQAEAVAKPGNAFAVAMASVGNPDVSGIEASADVDNPEAALAGQILSAFGIKS